MPSGSPGSDDFEVCNSTWKSIIERHGRNPKATDFSPMERTVVLVWSVNGIIGNGGFEYLFGSDLPGDPTYQLTVEAFRAIGGEEAARALEDAIAIFPDGKVPPDNSERKALFLSRPEEQRDRLAGRFFRLEQEITSLLAAYIRKQHLSKSDQQRGH